MKRCLLPLLLLILCLTACDPYAGKRPNDYPNTRWACADPAIDFYVYPDGRVLSDVRQEHETSPELSLHFDYGSGFYISAVGTGAELFAGKCKFGPEKLTVKVERDELFAGKYAEQEIVFTRSDWDGVLPPGVTEPPAASEPVETKPLPQLPLPENLIATWVNAGAYSGGRDYVETLTLYEDNTLRVHLDYEGKPYTDLTGTVIRRGETLSFLMSDGTKRTYRFEVDANILTLIGEDRTVTYRRSD